jgi:hypothetical protein
MYVYMCIYCIYTCVYIYMHVYIQIHIHIYICNTYTHNHTYIHIKPLWPTFPSAEIWRNIFVGAESSICADTISHKSACFFNAFQSEIPSVYCSTVIFYGMLIFYSKSWYDFSKVRLFLQYISIWNFYSVVFYIDFL